MIMSEAFLVDVSIVYWTRIMSTQEGVIFQVCRPPIIIDTMWISVPCLHSWLRFCAYNWLGIHNQVRIQRGTGGPDHLENHKNTRFS